MRVALVNILTIAIFTYCTTGQWAEDPSITFEGLEFDYQQRGQFNITPCIRDLMNCYELIKPEVHCTYVWGDTWDRSKSAYYKNITYHGSACDIMKMYCHDIHGYHSDLKYHWFNMPRKIIDVNNRTDCRDFVFT